MKKIILIIILFFSLSTYSQKVTVEYRSMSIQTGKNLGAMEHLVNTVRFVGKEEIIWTDALGHTRPFKIVSIKLLTMPNKEKYLQSTTTHKGKVTIFQQFKNGDLRIIIPELNNAIYLKP